MMLTAKEKREAKKGLILNPGGEGLVWGWRGRY